jgi:RimJ/RimL family protein N-acetyltransferase
MPAWRFPEPPLDDGVVALRPWRAEDAPLVAAWAADEPIVSWSGISADYTAAAALAFMEQAEQGRRAGFMITMAIVDTGSGALLGSCDIRCPDPDDPGLGEVGYLLAPEARGHGAATRTVGLLVGWAFDKLGMRRVQALVHPDNPRSAAVLERLGFRREGLLRSYRPGGEDRIMFAATAARPRRPAPRPARDRAARASGARGGRGS